MEVSGRELKEADGDEARAVAALRELAALDRSARGAVDWSAVTGG